jgi:flagellar biosynthesis protein FlhF
MKIVRHVAPDMRQALRSIRAQLGEDAVILSSRRIPEGVEVTAAVDFDASALQAAASDAMSNPAAALAAAPLPPTSAPVSDPMPAAGSSYSQLAGDRAVSEGIPSGGDRAAQSHAAAAHYFPAQQPVAEAARPFAHILGSDPIPVRVSQAPAPQAYATQHTPAAAHATAVQHATQRAAAPVAVTPAGKIVPAAPAGDFLADRSVRNSHAGRSVAAATASASPASDTTGAELKTLRRMLETQLAQLAWNDLTRRAPAHVEILRELTEIGISPDLSDYILKQLPEKVELSAARRFAISGLAQYLRVTGDRWLENGGRVAFIGATGVGKTTTLAKLAVRWVLRHGPRDLALVGSDTVRIGAQDQIQSLGQLLGVPVYTPDTFESLPTLLPRLGDRHRLILIDTPGTSGRDAQLGTRLSVLSNCASQMETALVLGASTQAGALEETVTRFAPANPACCVLTKLDEAASLGGALSALIRARLPVSYLSEGQRVPEDLRPARSLELVSAAVRLAKASGAAADEDLLRRRFGKTANAIT